MNVAVLGLWHLGSVTAACVARAGHTVLAYDPHSATVEALRAGRPPVFEPGLSELRFRPGSNRASSDSTTELSECVRNAELVWITFDAPVDEDDVADAGHVERQVEAAFPYLAPAAVLLCSSQLPVGTVARLESRWRDTGQGEQVSFYCSPENLRLGKAIDAASRIRIASSSASAMSTRARLTELFAPIAERIEWMSVESAEMTKHALNAFLATSVTFIVRWQTLCRAGWCRCEGRRTRVCAAEQRRISRGAYLSPRSAFAGGTLARDVGFLRALGDRLEHATPLMDGVLASNGDHGLWARRKLAEELGDLRESPGSPSGASPTRAGDKHSAPFVIGRALSLARPRTSPMSTCTTRQPALCRRTCRSRAATTIRSRRRRARKCSAWSATSWPSHAGMWT